MKPTNVTGYPFSNGDRLTAISVNQICNALDAIQDYNDTIKEFEDLVEENTDELKQQISATTESTVAAVQNMEIMTLDKDVEYGKQEIADAINSMGGTATEDMSLVELANAIKETIVGNNVTAKGMVADQPTNSLQYFVNDSIANRLHMVSINNSIIKEISVDRIFCNSQALTSVSLTELETISGQRVFNGCVSLISINLPNLVNVTGSGIFGGCVGLTIVTFPKLKTITGNDCFFGCSSLNEINLPNLESTWTSMFQNCFSLKRVIMPVVRELIGSQSFYNCQALEELVVGTLTTANFNALFNNNLTRLRKFVIGADTNINIAFGRWTAINVIAEGQSGIDELNANIMANIVPNLYQGGGKTITFGAALYNVLTEETKKAIAESVENGGRGWTLASA